MNKNTRQQLTLFVKSNDASEIENIRKKFNPVQHQLIASHVTLCREDEIADINQVLLNLQNLDAYPIKIQFANAARFNHNKGVLLPASGSNDQFHQLRKKILQELNMPVQHHEPHITLMHPRNSSCNDNIFEEICMAKLPVVLTFDTISLIEQLNGGKWEILGEYKLKGF